GKTAPRGKYHCSSRAFLLFFYSSRRRHTRCLSDWSSDVCSSDLSGPSPGIPRGYYYHRYEGREIKNTIGWVLLPEGNIPTRGIRLGRRTPASRRGRTSAAAP